jgi:hypothetical protein
MRRPTGALSVAPLDRTIARRYNRAMSHEYPSRRLVLAGLAAIPLAACNETTGDFNPATPPRARAPGVPVALVSLDGAPEAVISRLSVAMSQQAARRDIAIVGIDGKPRYQVRGYLSAHVDGGEGQLSWAFDIFDAQKKRARRVSGQEALRGGGDAWTGVTDAHLTAIAFKSLDDIAEFLAASPETVAQRGAAPASARRAASILAGH